MVLLDVHMPDGGGVEVIRARGRRRAPRRCSWPSRSPTTDDVIAVIRAGARGYVTKSISGPDLADAVRRVHGGDAVFSPRLAGFVLDAFAGPAPQADSELDALTPREHEVLQHIARGYMYKEIALRWTSRPRPWRPTCRRCCASSSSRAATSCRAGRPSAGSIDQGFTSRSFRGTRERMYIGGGILTLVLLIIIIVLLF